MDDIKSSLSQLHNFCRNEKYLGYSLYDSHNSKIPLNKSGRIPSFLINQVVKRSPINFRPVLGVKKGINPKGYGLFLHSYSLLTNLDVMKKEEMSERSHFFFDWLRNNFSKGYSGMCWGYNYYWPKKDGNNVPAFTPSVVVTGFVARAMLAYYETFNKEEVKEVLSSAAKFVLQDVHTYKGEDGICFSYTPLKKDLTVNANLLAAEILAYCDHINNENKYSNIISEALRFTMNNQNDDGSWYYSFNYETREPKKQIDFHQGYVIESIMRLYNYSDLKLTDDVRNKLELGLKFYYEKQFHDRGWSYWRYPKKWPVDIHNQSQGIITFSQCSKFNKEYTSFAKTIINWTIKNMQASPGNFYYQKWPLITNKVNYLRWNQAWMLLALSTYLVNSE